MLTSIKPALRGLVKAYCSSPHFRTGNHGTFVRQTSLSWSGIGRCQQSSSVQFSTETCNQTEKSDIAIDVEDSRERTNFSVSALEHDKVMQDELAERPEDETIQKKTVYKKNKFHNRVLSKEERFRDRQMIHDMSTLPESEIFGSLGRKKTVSPGTSYPKNIRNRMFDKTVSPDSKETFQPRFQENHVGENFSQNDDDQHSGPHKSKPDYFLNKHNDRHKLRANTSKHAKFDRETNYHHRTAKKDEGSWSETFGTLDEDFADKIHRDDTRLGEDGEDDSRYHSDEEDERPHRRLSDHGRNSANWYGRRILEFAEEGKIKEAIDVLEVWMLKNERIRPNYYVFSNLISVLGRAGYTKKAFQVFNTMKKMGVKPKDNTYTALFNACSNSPWPEDGLARAGNLRSLMTEQGKSPNLITYRAMIKAFGVCGDLQTAFALLDEVSERFRPDVKCFSFLLMACCSDKEAGFRHAIQVWRLMRQRRLTPDLYLYNLLLRVTRDCGIGDLKLATQLLYGDSDTTDGDDQHRQLLHKGSTDHPTDSNRSSGIIHNLHRLSEQTWLPDETDKAFNPSSESREYVQLANVDNTEGLICVPGTYGGSDLESVQVHQSSQEILPAVYPIYNIENVPNILNGPLPENQHGLISVKLDSLKSPEARLALAGGAMDILKNMESDGVRPDIKTLSQLVSCIPSNREAENYLLQILDEKNIKPDVVFFNMIIRKRNLRRDYQGAKEILALVGQHQLVPDLISFGCLSMGCHKKADGEQLLKDIQSAGLMPNTEIFTILVLNSRGDFWYKLHLVKQMEQLSVSPSIKLLDYLEHGVQYGKQKIVDQERGRAVDKFFKSDYFHDGYKEFMKYYRPWLQRMPLETKEHPWTKFRHPKPEITEDHSMG